MARNRVIYQSEGLYVSKEYNSTGSGQHFQLKRVQSANYNFNIARQDVNQYGQLARIDSIVLETPTVGLDCTYYVTDGKNEAALGFYVQMPGSGAGQFPSGHVQDGTGRNFYIVTSSEGNDLNAEANLSGKSAIGVGNAYLTNYTLDLAVGSIPTASVSFEASNMNAFTISGGNSGSGVGINPASGTSLGLGVLLPNSSNATGTVGDDSVSALRPGDVTISFGAFTGTGVGGFTSLSDLHIQSASLSLPLGRTPIQQLGTKFAFARVVDFPVVSTLTVNGVQAETSQGSLVDLIEANPKNDITISIKKPGGGGANAITYTISRAQLDSIGMSSSIGSNKTVDLTFSTQIGGANDAANGIKVSGSYTGSVF
jgi:hypothetical protein